jgi:FkbM family methyltransferase
MAKLLVSKGDVVWDVGANLGIFSSAAAFMSGPSGRVIAYEADVWLVNLLLRTSRSLGATYAPIDVVNIAIAGDFGFAEFAIAARSREANFLMMTGGATPAGGVRSSYRMLTQSLDNMLTISDKPKVVKIDIECAELIALRGAKRLINDVRPRIVCEVDPNNANPLNELLTKANYKVYNAENSGMLPVPVVLPTLNSLFVPCEDPLVESLSSMQTGK